MKILSTHRGETTWCVQPPRMLKLSQNLTTIISLTAILARHQRNRPRNLPFYHRVAFRIVYENAQAGRPCLSFPKAHLPQERLEYLTRPHLWKSTALNSLHLPRWRIRPARPSSQQREVDMVIKILYRRIRQRQPQARQSSVMTDKTKTKHRNHHCISPLTSGRSLWACTAGSPSTLSRVRRRSAAWCRI